MKCIIGNYYRTADGWRRYRTLQDCTGRWWEINSVKLFGGTPTRAERDQYARWGVSR